MSQALSTDGKSENLYDRYKDDPAALEKQTTLASVLLTVDFDALSEMQKQQITQELKALNDNLQKVGNIKLFKKGAQFNNVTIFCEAMSGCWSKIY